MGRIAENGDCGVAFSVRGSTEMMLVELVGRPGAVAMNLNAGSRIAVCETVPGRACPAAMSAEERAEVFESFADRHGGTFEDEKNSVLEESRERVARNGNSDAFGEWVPDGNAVGVVLRAPVTGDIFTLTLAEMPACFRPAG